MKPDTNTAQIAPIWWNSRQLKLLGINEKLHNKVSPPFEGGETFSNLGTYNTTLKLTAMPQGVSW